MKIFDVVLNIDDILFEVNEKELTRLRHEIIGKCKKCDNGQIFSLDTHKGPSLSVCKCVKKYNKHAKLVKAGIPVNKIDKINKTGGFIEKRYVPFSFLKRVTGDSYQYKSMPGKSGFLYQHFLNRYLSKKKYMSGDSILLFGPNGCGKTATALDVLERLSRIKQFSVYYISMRELVNLFISMSRASAAMKQFSSDVKLYNYIINCDFLVIDELGKELQYDKMTEDVNIIVETIIKIRTERGKAMIIVTNYNPQEIYEKYTDSIVSVLNESFLF